MFMFCLATTRRRNASGAFTWNVTWSVGAISYYGMITGGGHIGITRQRCSETKDDTSSMIQAAEMSSSFDGKWTCAWLFWRVKIRLSFVVRVGATCRGAIEQRLGGCENDERFESLYKQRCSIAIIFYMQRFASSNAKTTSIEPSSCLGYGKRIYYNHGPLVYPTICWLHTI